MPAAARKVRIKETAIILTPAPAGPHAASALGAIAADVPAAVALILLVALAGTAVALVATAVALARARARASSAAELQRARERAEEEELRSALLSSLAHDLRSPLTAILGAATSLDEAMPAAGRRELVGSIVTEARRLDRYVQNLLDMARLGRGPLQIRRDWVAADEVVASAVARLRQVVPGAGTRLEAPEECILLHVHPALVEQALFNVLENAARFTPPGEVIAVRLSADARWVSIDVVDRGPGMPDAERARLLENFRRSDSSGLSSGLGLAICRAMIAAHGGRLEAGTGDGGIGTRVRLLLPRTTPPPGGAEAP